ncbi:MAG TPA: D-alanyl-D-alanine carboxypeptidase/D-alanyl-D-alanine-endopeptidase, partial [Verrucomicrobiales bacterium]|nr:D-alanyl-D-alanine carboxypeptidase/D-alanyl-D-alanine-endopeptidase [Verrucomicrobiales bacterium]
EPLTELRADRAMIPASTLKVVTTATALEVLGPEFRFVTRLRAAGRWDADGVLEGDLYVTGGGDPALQSGVLREWATELAAEGLKEVRGDVIGDARFFPEEILSGAWNWGDVGNYYGAGAAGLNVDHNRYRAVFRPGTSAGDAAELLRVEPEPYGVRLINGMRTGPEGSGDRGSAFASAYGTEVRFSGTVPAGAAEFGISGATPDPPRQAASVMRAALSDAGVEVGGEALTDRELRERGESPSEFPAGAVDLRIHESVPLEEIVRHLHFVSDNVEAECCYRLLARRAGVERGVEAIERHWASRGLQFEGLRMEDGSGLARADVIRPLDLARLLREVRRGPYGEVFYASLPAHREGRVRWKGGAMSRVRGYAGYVETRTRGELVLVLMVNHQEPDEAALSEWKERILERVMGL